MTQREKSSFLAEKAIYNGVLFLVIAYFPCRLSLARDSLGELAPYVTTFVPTNVSLFVFQKTYKLRCDFKIL